MTTSPPLPGQLPHGGYVLGIDTATPAGGVALAGLGGELIAHTWRAQASPIAAFLLSDVDRMLREMHVAPEQIAAVAVTHGPGAFTGLRLGLALAKTLAHGWGAPLFAYSTLEMMARRWPLAGATVGVLLDARRGEIYSGVYRIETPGKTICLRPERAESIAEFLEDFSMSDSSITSSGPFYLTGSGAEKYRAELSAALGARAAWIAPPWEGPAADLVALSGARDLRDGKSGQEAFAVEPLYLRVSDAERRHPQGFLAAAPPWSTP